MNVPRPRILPLLLLFAAAAARAEWTPKDFEAADGRAEAALAADRRGEAADAVARMAVPDSWPIEERVERLIKRGELKDALGDYAGAEGDYRAVLALRPTNFDVLCRLTQFLRDRGRFADSLAAAQVLVTVTKGILPENRVEKWLQRGETYMRLGRYPEAESDIRHALAVAPDDPPSLELLVQIFLWAGRPSDALVYADEMARTSAPGARLARALGLRAQVRERLGDAAGADDDVARALGAAPGDRTALEARVQRLASEGRDAEALVLLDRLISGGRSASAAQRASLFQRRGEARRRLGDAAGAEADLRAALAIQDDALVPLRELAGLLLDSGRGAEAEALSARLLAAASESVPSTRAAGLVLRARVEDAAGRRPQAVEDLREAARLDPGSFSAREGQVLLALEDGRIDDAAALSESMFEVISSSSSPERMSALLLRARVRTARGLLDDAAADLSAARALDPRAPDVLAALAALAAGRGRAAETSADAEELFAGTPAGDASALPALVAAVEALTRVGLAERALAEARALAAGSASAAPGRRADVYAAAAAAEEKLGRSRDALDDFERALSLAPGALAPLGRRPRLLAELGRPREALAAADAFVAAASSAPAAQAAEARLTRAELRAAAADWRGAAGDHEEAERLVPGVHLLQPEAGVSWSAAAAKGRRSAGWELLASLRAQPGVSTGAAAVLASAEAEALWSGGGDRARARAAMSAALAADAAAACRGPLLEEHASAAAEYFDACVSRWPRDAGLRNDRGVSRWSAGRREAAEADFRAALDADPGFLPAAMSLASALAGTRRAADGLGALRAALALPQSDAALVRAARDLLTQLAAR